MFRLNCSRLDSPLLHMLLLLGTTFLVYGFSLQHQFLSSWDDNLYVTRNLDAQGFTLEHLRAAFSTFYVGNYAPLQIISYMFDYTFWPNNPAGYIGANIVIHALNGLLFYRLVAKLTASYRLALFSSFIFLLHPVQVESVVWISQRKNVLAMFFFLVSLLSYIGYRRNEARRRHTCYAVALFTFLCALLTKSVVVVLPVVLVLYDFCFAPQKNRSQWIVDKLPFVAAAVAVALITLKSQAAGAGGGMVNYPDESAFGIFITMLTVFASYARMLVWPTKLSIFYYTPVKTAVDLPVILSAILMILLGAGLAYLFRKDKRTFFWAALIPVGILPVSQIIPLSTMMNDRYLYFPLLGFAVLVVIGADYCFDRFLPGKQAAASTLLCLMLLPLPILSWERSTVWYDSLSIWSDALDKSPNFVTYAGMGNALYKANRLDDAIYMYNQALRLEPTCEEALRSLSAIYLNAGEYNKAAYYINLFVQNYPDNPLGQQLMDTVNQQLNMQRLPVSTQNRP